MTFHMTYPGSSISKTPVLNAVTLVHVHLLQPLLGFPCSTFASHWYFAICAYLAFRLHLHKAARCGYCS